MGNDCRREKAEYENQAQVDKDKRGGSVDLLIRGDFEDVITGNLFLVFL